MLERVAESDHPGRLAPLRRAVSAEPVLAPEVAALSALVAERYAGTRSDVLRLAVPPRHATTEKEATARPTGRRQRRDAAVWRRPGGGATTGRADWSQALAAAGECAAGGVDRPARRGLGDRPGARGGGDARRRRRERCSACRTTATSPGSTRR